MIHPDAEIVDVDPDAWGALADVVVRARAAQPWIHVLYENGKVISLVGHSLGAGRLPSLGDEVGDPWVLARRLHASTGVARVVLIDRDHLPQIVKSVSASVHPTQTVDQFRRVVHHTYWTSPGIATYPEPPPWPWDAVRVALSRHGSSAVGLVRVIRDGEPMITLLLTAEDGLVRRVSGSPRPLLAGEEAPAYDVTLDWSRIVAALRTARPIRAVAELLLASPHSPPVAELADLLLAATAPG